MASAADLPRIPYAQRAWFTAFEKIIALGAGARLTANGVKYRLHHWNPDPDYAWIELKDKQGNSRTVRRGDVLMLELQPTTRSSSAAAASYGPHDCTANMQARCAICGADPATPNRHSEET